MITKLNPTILERCKKYYPQVEKSLNCLTYKIERFDLDLQRITIRFGEHEGCPLYCICSGNYMIWFGDHGSFTFDCTWNTSLNNIPFESPYYLFGKLDKINIESGKEFNSGKCRKEILDTLYSSYWWEEEVLDVDKSNLKEYFETQYCDVDDFILMGEYDELMLERCKRLINHSYDRFEVIQYMRELEQGDPLYDDDQAIYNAGWEISPHFWFIFLCLNYVFIKEDENKENNS